MAGRMKAKAVQTNAPDKFMNRPNLGTIIAEKPVKRTRADLTNIDLTLGYLRQVGILSYSSAFSAISIAGINWIGNEHSSPKE